MCETDDGTMTPGPSEAVRKKSDADFIFGKAIGEGSFGTVYLAKDIHTAKVFASKFFVDCCIYVFRFARVF